MNFDSIPDECFIDKRKKIVRYIPEKKVIYLKYDAPLWKRKFPSDINNIDLDLDSLCKLKLTNIGSYSIATPEISNELIYFIHELYRTKIMPNHEHPKKFEDLTITETHGGVGGFTLRLANAFKNVHTVEINPIHSSIIEHNLKIYNLYSQGIKILSADYLDVMMDIENDVIISDPPWGGFSYAGKKSIKLGIDNINITYIINELWKRDKFKLFILMTPRNFDIQDFINSILSQDIIIRNMHKHYFIAVVGRV